MTRALIVIDMQDGFNDLAFWGPTANPACEANVAALIEAWTARDEPIIVVHHDSLSTGSPLHPGNPGNALMGFVAAAPAALTIAKHVNSAFYGDVDLHAWLAGRGIHSLVICGIQTNMCVETTARMAGNLGYDVTLTLDATRTLDMKTQIAGLSEVSRTAAELMAVTALNLQAGGFAVIATTEALLAEESADHSV